MLRLKRGENVRTDLLEANDPTWLQWKEEEMVRNIRYHLLVMKKKKHNRNFTLYATSILNTNFNYFEQSICSLRIKKIQKYLII